MKAALMIALLVLGLLGAIGYLLDANSSITGRDVATSVNILPAVPSPCNFTISQGWNMVSFFCLGSWVERRDALGPINSSYGKVFSYMASDSQDPWKSYNPDLPNWTVQQLVYFDRLSGYWIYMDEESSYFHEGTKKSSSISLYQGWNLVGYTSTQSENISQSLNGLGYTEVKTWSNGAFLVYMPSGAQDFSNFSSYKAYWVNSTSSQVWELDP